MQRKENAEGFQKLSFLLPPLPPLMQFDKWGYISKKKSITSLLKLAVRFMYFKHNGNLSFLDSSPVWCLESGFYSERESLFLFIFNFSFLFRFGFSLGVIGGYKWRPNWTEEKDLFTVCCGHWKCFYFFRLIVLVFAFVSLWISISMLCLWR